MCCVPRYSSPSTFVFGLITRLRQRTWAYYGYHKNRTGRRRLTARTYYLRREFDGSGAPTTNIDRRDSAAITICVSDGFDVFFFLRTQTKEK